MSFFCLHRFALSTNPRITPAEISRYRLIPMSVLLISRQPMKLQISWLLSRLVDVLSQLVSYNVRYNQFDNTTFRLDWFLGVLDRFSPTNLEDKVIIDRLIAQLQQVKAIVVQLDNDILMGYCPQKIYSQYRGRPSFDIPKEQIELFLECNFSLPQISEILGVSLSTVNRRLKDYGLSVTQTYSTISATELDKITQQLVSEFPNCGYRRMTGFLRAQGIHVQQIRVRENCKRVDEKIWPRKCFVTFFTTHTNF